MIRSMVVLPLPDGPSTAVMECSATVSVASDSTGVAPNDSCQPLDLQRVHLVPRWRENHAPRITLGTAANPTMTAA